MSDDDSSDSGDVASVSPAMQKIKENISLPGVIQLKSPQNSSETIAVMSSSGDSSEDDLEPVKEGNNHDSSIEVVNKSDFSDDDDIFSDIFKSSDNVKKLDTIINPAKASEGNKVSTEDDSMTSKVLEAMTKFDKPGEIFAAIANSRKNSAPQASKDAVTQSFKSSPLQSTPEKNGVVGQEPEEVASLMKKSGHLWMKIASKYAEDAISKSPNKASKRTVETSEDSAKRTKRTELDEDQDKLIKEMRNTEAANRLLKFTNITYNADTAADSNEEAAADAELEQLGITAVNTDTYSKQVLQQEGLVDSSTKINETTESAAGPSSAAVIYTNAVPGFSRSSKDALPVVRVNERASYSFDLDPDDPGHPDDPGVDEDELYAIQAELARENSSLVAEMAKSDRISGSITDQMYTECQAGVHKVPYPSPWVEEYQVVKRGR